MQVKDHEPGPCYLSQLWSAGRAHPLTGPGGKLETKPRKRSAAKRLRAAMKRYARKNGFQLRNLDREAFLLDRANRGLGSIR